MSGTTQKTCPRWSVMWRRKPGKTRTTWRPIWPFSSCESQIDNMLLYFVTASQCHVVSARYQFNPAYFQTDVTSQILLKALTNLPHTDFTLCKCMIDQTHVSFWYELRFCLTGSCTFVKVQFNFVQTLFFMTVLN